MLKLGKKAWGAMALAVCVSWVTANDAIANEEEEGRRPAATAADLLESITQHARYLRKNTPTEPIHWWAVSIRETMSLTQEVLCVHGAEPVARLFVEKFGKVDAATDAFVLFGHYWMFVPLYGGVIGSEYEPGKLAKVSADAKMFYDWRNTVAAAQVKLFLKEPGLFDRYFRACMWSQLPFEMTAPGEEVAEPEDYFDAKDPYNGLAFAFENLCQHFPHNKTPQSAFYWFYARQFMFLAKATSQERYLQDAKPDELYEAFERWRDYVAPHIHYVLPHPKEPRWFIDRDQAVLKAWKSQDYQLPEGPFPDWNYDAPPPGYASLNVVGSVPVPDPCIGPWRKERPKPIRPGSYDGGYGVEYHVEEGVESGCD